MRSKVRERYTPRQMEKADRVVYSVVCGVQQDIRRSNRMGESHLFNQLFPWSKANLTLL